MAVSHRPNYKKSKGTIGKSVKMPMMGNTKMADCNCGTMKAKNRSK